MILEPQTMTGEDDAIDPNADFISNCCGALTTEPDRDLLARCLDCKEMCWAVTE